MTLDEKIYNFVESWAKLLSDDLKASLDKALMDGGSNRGQYDLDFKENVKVSNGSVIIQVEANGDYWDYVEQGVDGTKTKHGSDYSYKKKAIDFNAVEDWMKREGVDAKRILLQMEVKRRGLSKTKNKLSPINRSLSKVKKSLSYQDAVNVLAPVFATSIAREGLKPKPFIDRVYNKERILQLTEGLSEIMGQEITAQLDLNNEFRNIKIEI